MENSNWNTLASTETIAATQNSLEGNGFSVVIAENAAEAKAKALELLPEGAEVMTMTSITLDTLGLSEEVNTAEKYNSIRKIFSGLNKEHDADRMQKLGAAPQWVMGSVHALTEDGHAVIASLTGSQLPAYAYGSQHVVWIVGAQKIVKNLDEAIQRIYEHVLPLESERAHKAYGVPGSSVNKVLIMNKEATPNRITIILVKEALGF